MATADDGGDVITTTYAGHDVENNVVASDKEAYVEDETESNVTPKKASVEDKDCRYCAVVETCGALEEIIIGAYCSH